VVEVVVEVVVEEYCHQDHPRQPGKMCLHHEEKSKLWDSSHESSQGTKAKPMISSTSFVAT
jgi:hypothetical protein